MSAKLRLKINIWWIVRNILNFRVDISVRELQVMIHKKIMGNTMTSKTRSLERKAFVESVGTSVTSSKPTLSIIVVVVIFMLLPDIND